MDNFRQHVSQKRFYTCVCAILTQYRLKEVFLKSRMALNTFLDMACKTEPR